MKRVFFTAPVIKVFTVAGVLLGLAGVIYLMSGMPAPREQDRVEPVDGSFSMIKPRGWESRIAYSPPQRDYRVRMDFFDPKSLEVNQRIEVGQFRDKPDPELLKKTGYVPQKLADQTALVWERKLRRQYIWQVVFERDGGWYEMMLILPYPLDVPSSPWWAYVQSFRAKPVATTQPSATTLPGG